MHPRPPIPRRHHPCTTRLVLRPPQCQRRRRKTPSLHLTLLRLICLLHNRLLLQRRIFHPDHLINHLLRLLHYRCPLLQQPYQQACPQLWPLFNLIQLLTFIRPKYYLVVTLMSTTYSMTILSCNLRQSLKSYAISHQLSQRSLPSRFSFNTFNTADYNRIVRLLYDRTHTFPDVTHLAWSAQYDYLRIFLEVADCFRNELRIKQGYNQIRDKDL